MRTHVFIVNDSTFPSHLQYLFAGTGAYNQKRKIWLDEHIGLLSDIKRVREGDLVIFYIEASRKIKGGFYGIFKIAEQNPIVFHTPGESGFQPSLNTHKLIYRTLIIPYEVYSEGVPEWEVLDKLPVYSTDIQWSLIYRKLKGKRGCTPLLSWEAQRLMDIIRNKNQGRPIANTQSRAGFDWNKTNRRIITTKCQRRYPYPRRFDFDIFNALYELWKQGKAYESYLELYFTANIGIDNKLDAIVGNHPMWFGNQVACGMGMQKIDILTICKNKGEIEYRIIELKDEVVKPDIVEQMEYYINWASQKKGRHLDGALSRNIQPIVVAPKITKKLRANGTPSKRWDSIVKAFKSFNKMRLAKPILYFEFELGNRNIDFIKVGY